MVGRRTPARRALSAPPDTRPPEPGAAPRADRDPQPEIEGLYGPRSEAWRLNREAALLLGAGPRALLLQVAHPLVAQGVADHSDLRSDPWGRLVGTLRSYLRIVYGPASAARAEIRRLNGLHRGVTGRVDDPGAALVAATYAARDPELALWVHATLIDSTLAAVDAWLGPVAPDRRARFYAETLVVGRLFGIPPNRLPPDIDAFDAYVAGMLGPSGPVHPTATARDLARLILRPSLPALVDRGPVARRLGDVAAPLAASLLARVPAAATDWLFVPALGLLPATTRAEYGLSWGARERAIDTWLVAAWRAWIGVLPERVRWFPQARAAFERASAAPR